MLKPAALLAIAAAPLVACSPLKILNVVVPAAGYEFTRDIAYRQRPRQRLDVYTPSRDLPAPVVVFFYGGRWSDGAKAEYRFVGQALASRGLVAVIADYRVYPQVRFPAFVEDGAKAVRWTHRHVARYGGRPECMFLMGHSAGAHIAALLTLRESYLRSQDVPLTAVRGMIGLAGPYDFLPLTASDLKDIFAPAGDLRRTQPIRFVGGDEPPLLLMTGADDTKVKPANSINLARRVREVGGRARLVQYPGRGHAGILLALAAPLRWLAPVLRDASGFISRRCPDRYPDTR